MGESAQNRLIRKLDLERFLNRVKPHPSPDVNLEQYTLSTSAAATMLYLAAYTYGDIVGKRVLDLGCGTGRLALGAIFLGAESAVGVDIDKVAINGAIENSVNSNLRDRVDWVVGDINVVNGQFDTVLQNPPFGVQKRNADRKFLEKALDVADAVYSLHNHPVTDKRLLTKLKVSGGQPLQVETSPFLQKFVEEHGGRVEAVYALMLTIPKMFDFHTRSKYETAIDLYVIRKVLARTRL
jgi:putative methylase